MTLETTQFGMVELNALDLSGVTRKLTAKEEAMDLFKGLLAAKEESTAQQLAGIGGLENLQRVRVFREGEATRFELVPKLPLSILEAKRREAEREKRIAEAKAHLEELKDPKKREEFVRKVLQVLIGRAALDLLRMSKGQKPLGLRGPAKPKRPVNDWDRAIQQDRQNRIAASKAAAEEYHKTHPAKVKEAAA